MSDCETCSSQSEWEVSNFDTKRKRSKRKHYIEVCKVESFEDGFLRAIDEDSFMRSKGQRSNTRRGTLQYIRCSEHSIARSKCPISFRILKTTAGDFVLEKPIDCQHQHNEEGSCRNLPPRVREILRDLYFKNPSMTTAHLIHSIEGLVGSPLSHS